MDEISDLQITLIVLEGLWFFISWILIFKWVYNIKKSTAETVEAVDNLGDLVENMNKVDFYHILAKGDFDKVRDYSINRLVDVLLPFYMNAYDGDNFDSVARIMDREISPILKVIDRCNIEVPAHLRDGKIFIDYMNRFHPKGLKNE